MEASPSTVLLCHTGTNAFSGEYSNCVHARRRKGGIFTLWVYAAGVDSSKRDCWQKNIRTPAEFISGFLACLNFCGFDDIGITELYTVGIPVLRKLDLRFAK